MFLLQRDSPPNDVAPGYPRRIFLADVEVETLVLRTAERHRSLSSTDDQGCVGSGPARHAADLEGGHQLGDRQAEPEFDPEAHERG